MVLYAVAQASRLKRENVCESKQMSGPEQAAFLRLIRQVVGSVPLSLMQTNPDGQLYQERETREMRKKEQQQAQD